jgi:hypothetical protein
MSSFGILVGQRAVADCGTGSLHPPGIKTFPWMPKCLEWLITGVACISINRFPGTAAAFTALLRLELTPDINIIVVEDGKTFQVAGCPLTHDKPS